MPQEAVGFVTGRCPAMVKDPHFFLLGWMLDMILILFNYIIYYN